MPKHRPWAEAELSRVVPDMVVPSGIAASRSGLVMLHLAAVKLGLIEPGSKAEVLMEKITDDKIRKRIEDHLGRGGLTDGDLHRLADANEMFASRATKIDFDPFELISDRWGCTREKAARASKVQRGITARSLCVRR